MEVEFITINTSEYLLCNRSKILQHATKIHIYSVVKYVKVKNQSMAKFTCKIFQITHRISTSKTVIQTVSH